MNERQEMDWPAAIHAELRARKIAHVAYVPDAGHSRLIELCRADNGMQMVTLTSEEEGIALLAGSWLGGVRGVLLMQSSGVGNCINMLSLAKTCGFPLLMLVTMRGEAGEFNPWQVPMGGISGETLKLAGVDVYRAEKAAEIGDRVAAAAEHALSASTACAVLIAQALIGVKTFDQAEES